jgi:hypothetical protein
MCSDRTELPTQDRAENRGERQVIGDLGRSAKHALADIVEGICVVVGPQICRIAKEDVGEFAAEFERRVRDVITEIRLEDWRILKRILKEGEILKST